MRVETISKLFWPIPSSRSSQELSNGVPNAFGFDRRVVYDGLKVVYMISVFYDI